MKQKYIYKTRNNTINKDCKSGKIMIIKMEADLNLDLE